MDSEPKPHPLIFDWRGQDRHFPALMKWFFSTIAAMTAFAYVFKVVYPQSQRVAPVPQQITVLNAADPSMRGLLRKVADQDFLVIPHDQLAGQVRLDEFAPVFHPSYEKHELQLQDLPHKTFNVPPARLLDPSEPMLPPPDLSQLKKAPEASPSEPGGKQSLSLVFTGALAKRKTAHSPDLNALKLTDPEAWRFHVGVDERGRVAFALPIATGEAAALTPEIVTLIGEMRFEPAPKNEGTTSRGMITWDVANLQWGKTTVK